jgi:DNA primase
MKDDAFRDHIRRLKDAVRGQDVAARIGMTGRGKRFFCPSCQPAGGKTPDLDVFDEGFKCYKCGKSGDAIDLAVLAGGMSKAEAIVFIEGMAGISRPAGSGKGRAIPSGQLKVARPGRNADVLFPGRAEIPPKQAAADHSDLYEKFLTAVCQPLVASAGAEYLAGRGIDADVADRVGVRFCPDPSRLWTLADRDIIQAAGLSSLYVFQVNRLPFLVFPYIRQGRPVYLKSRCLLTKDEADQRKVPRFLNTGGRVPCLWNHDAIAAADQVLICEGEIDALTAIQAGQTAVGVPGWAAFKDEWVRDFRDKDVILVMDADEAGRKGLRDIARRFQRAGLPAPRQMILDEGTDLNDFYLSKGGKG